MEPNRTRRALVNSACDKAGHVHLTVFNEGLRNAIPCQTFNYVLVGPQQDQLVGWFEPDPPTARKGRSG